MSNVKFGIENVTHQCQDCGMKFYNSHQLVNHMKKFCTASGLNSLEGLAQYQNTSAFSKKLKNYGANSLGTMKYQPTYNAQQLAKQAQDLERHREQLAANRHYNNTNTKRNQPINQQGGYQKSNVRKFNLNQHTNSRAAYGERVLGSSQISMHSLGNFGQGNPRGGGKNHIGSNKSLNSNGDQLYHSPPSALPSKPFGRNIGPSVLQKSNSSIANMSISQKKDYASDKLVELDNIAEMYDKSGGMNMDFRKNLQKMRKFYRQMLQNNQPFKKYPGQFAQSRVQTPIGKLRDLDVNQNFQTGRSKIKNEDILDKQLFNKSKAKSQKIQQNKKNNPNQVPINPYYTPYNQSLPNYPNPYYPPTQGMPPFNTFPQQPQIIMIPHYNQPPSQQQQQNQGISQQIKYFQKMLQLKNEQNKKLMKMLMDTKRQKNTQKVKSRVEQIRQSRIHSMRQDGVYHMETPMASMPSTQQKILLALQRQQLDQLRLLSTLPQELQQLKMQSVMRIIEQRTQVQKQILQQKVRRLQQQKRNQLQQQKVRLDKDQWANQQRKKLIGHQMDEIIDQFKKKVNGQDSQEQNQEEDDGYQPPMNQQ